MANLVDSPGKPLERGTQELMESGFGHDFASVRVHTDSAASDSAARIDAMAYTFGHHIAFRSPFYAPRTAAGRQLIAHELTHVVQQQRGGAISPQDSSGAHEAAPTDAGATIAAGGRTSRDLGATAIGVARQPMDPRHARGFSGEQEMAFRQYPAEQGWIFIEGPSGSAGHGVTTRGFDGVAFNTRTGELHLLDNKSLNSPTVRSATAIDPEVNLPQNVDSLVERVDAAENLPPQVRQRVLDLLWRTRQALTNRRPLPNRVRLVVTGVGGRSTGLSNRLASRGIEFEPQQTPSPPRPPQPPAAEPTAARPAAPTEPVRPAPAEPQPGAGRPGRGPRPGGQGEPSVGGGLLGLAVPLALGWLHTRTVESRIRGRTQAEGYVPPGAPSGEGLLYDLGAWLIDPFNDADRAVGFEARFNLPVWRARIRDLAGRKRPGETLSISWNVGLCRTDFFGNQEFETRELTYRKQPDGRWQLESGNTKGVGLDLNDIISPNVPDAIIKTRVMDDPCSA